MVPLFELGYNRQQVSLESVKAAIGTRYFAKYAVEAMAVEAVMRWSTSKLS